MSASRLAFYVTVLALAIFVAAIVIGLWPRIEDAIDALRRLQR